MRTRLGVMAAALLALAACGEDPQQIPGLEVVEVKVAPLAPTLHVGDTLRLTARPMNDQGIELGSVQVDWDVADASVADIAVQNNTVLVTAKRTGTTRVAASAEGKTGETTILVQPEPVARLVVAPHVGELMVGHQVALSGTAYSASGAELPARPMTWTTSTPQLVQLTQAPGNTAGVVVTAIAAGTARLRVASEGATEDVQLVISPLQQQPAGIVFNPPYRTLDIGDTMVVSAELRANDGTVVPGIPVIFSSSNPTILNVLPQLPGTSATVVAVSAGVAVLNAMGAGYQSIAAITVNPTPPPPPPVSFVVVTPRVTGMWANTTKSFAATPLAANGIPLIDRYVRWSVQDVNFGDIDAVGVFHAPPHAGVNHVVATIEGKVADAEVHVWEITPRMTFQLTFDWWDGEIHLMPSLAHGTFTDSAGVVHQTELYPESGTFTIDRTTGTYERRIVAGEWVTSNGAVHRRREVVLTDQGNMLYRWNPLVNGASTFEFWSATTAGQRYFGTLRAPGELLVSLPAASGQVMDLLFRLP